MAFDRAKFIAPYKAETLEHLSNLNSGLLKLEKNTKDKALLETLMREAHTIKGSSTMMGYKRIADIAHGMEDGLQKALEGKIDLQKSHFDMLFKCLDGISPLLEDKLTWEDAGVSGKFVEDLRQETTDVFLVKPTEKSSFTKEPKVIPVSNFSSVAEENIRVDISKLDKLMNFSGELLISKIRLNELVGNLSRKIDAQKELKKECGSLVKEMDKVDNSLDFITKGLEHEVLKLRMVSVNYLFNAFPRAMRDLAIAQGKDVMIEIRGENTQLDKAIIDEMKEPLMHILRNAVDHGIELPSARLSKNKPSHGMIILNAYQRGSQVVIEVSDDGRGIDINAVREQAVKKGLISQDKINELADVQVYGFLFLAGFSTTEVVSEVSGRGVGLDVVREKVAKLKGLIEVSSVVGKGTKFIIRLPLTIAITDSLFVVSGAETFALPVENIVEVIRVNPEQLNTVEAKEVVSLRGQILPLVRLNDVFGLPRCGIIEKKFFPVVIVQSVEKRIGLLVDQMLGYKKIMRKNLTQPINKINGINGVTILGDGRVVLILDVTAIIDIAQGTLLGSEYVKPKNKNILTLANKRRSILLAEDTLSTAMLEKNILESIGFSVVIARDGVEALEKASLEKFDLIITDVLMPRMDGFELTSRLKKDSLYQDIPVIIVTTREADADKRMGLECGADAYIFKSEFTSEGLLEAIERLVG